MTHSDPFILTAISLYCAIVAAIVLPIFWKFTKW